MVDSKVDVEVSRRTVEVRGTGYEVLGTRYEVLDTRYKSSGPSEERLSAGILKKAGS